MNRKTRREPPATSAEAPVEFSRLYEELRELASQKMSRELPGQTLQATALVHEAWLRLGGDQQPPWKNRSYFFAAAAEAMRRVLIDRARARNTERRGGRIDRIDLDALEIGAAIRDESLLALDEALGRFTEHDPTKAELVKLRYFAGLSLGEAARILSISEPTAKRYWAYARAWLFRELDPGR